MLRQALEAYSSSLSPVRVHSSSRSPVRRSSGVWACNDAESSPELLECSDEHENEQGVIALGVCALNKKANCRAMTDMLQVRTWLVVATSTIFDLYCYITVGWVMLCIAFSQCASAISASFR
jgi:hypothetical protein